MCIEGKCIGGLYNIEMTGRGLFWICLDVFVSPLNIPLNYRNMFLIFATQRERPRMLTNTYGCLAISLRSLRIGGELHS